MLQGLTRKVRDWLQGAEPDQPAHGAATQSAGAAVSEAARQLYRSAEASLSNGQASDALEAATRAAELEPRYAEAHNLAGLALRELARPEEAAARFQRAVEARHDFIAALNNHGMACCELRRFEDAEDSFNLALAFDPGSAEVQFNLGALDRSRGRPAEAIESFRRAVERDPGSAEAWLNLGDLLHAAGRFEEALAAFRQAQALRPDMADLQLNLGLTLVKLEREDEAAVCLERALDLKPDFAEAHYHLGDVRRRQERFSDAARCHERAIALKPGYAAAHAALGGVLKRQGALEPALEQFRKALALEPDDPVTYHNIGVAYNDLDRPRDAIACYEKAQPVSGDHPESRLNLAITQLLVGDLARGWAGYEWRFRQASADYKAVFREFPYPRWDGQPLAGRRILVWSEQGIGDEITFSSLYGEVAAAAQLCVIECAPKLVPLFARAFPGARVVPMTDPPHAETRQGYDYQAPSGGLARWLRPAVGAFPGRSGHLAAAPARVAHWKERLASLGEGLKVGFSWRSTNLKGDRALACTTLDEWGPLFRVPGVHWISLQYDECSAELAVARERFGVRLHAFPEVHLFNDIDEASALTQALDLVVSAPTSVSLLAAALGVPTWQMTCGVDWQVHGAGRNLWYPAMTQFKRAWDEPWDRVIDTMAARLVELTARGAAGTLPEAPWLSPAGETQEDDLETLLARGDRELAEDRLQEAAATYERATARPDKGAASAWTKLGIARLRQGLPEQAEAAFERVLELQPGSTAARLNRALARYEAGDFDIAVRDNEAVLQQQPDHPEARYNLALALLARGELARGWREYEWRFEQATLEEREISFPFPRWDGEDLAGKTLLVWKEQSVGAQIMFAGMFPELRARAGYCIVECTPKLVPLFARSFPDWDIVPRTVPPHPYTQHDIDFQIPSGSLARWLRASLAAYPRHQGYLRADPGRVAYWRERLRALGPGPKIGFSWRSINTRGERALACTTLDQWAPVLGIRGAHFACLQYDDCAAELEAARRWLGGSVHRFDGLDLFNDLDEAAALTSALDLVISAPTAVTDLSGALGVPTWQLHHGTDWKIHGAASHPWYPSLRRFQRGLHQPWEAVMDEVAAQLQDWMRACGT